MDQREIIFKFIRPRSKKPIAYILLVIALIMLAVGLYQDYQRKYCIVPVSTQSINVGAPVYADVIAISEPVYTVHNREGGTRYCYAIDSSGNCFTIKLYDDVYDALLEQQEYWSQLHTNARPPTPYRIRGSMERLLSAQQQSFAQGDVSVPDGYATPDIAYCFEPESDILPYVFSAFVAVTAIISLMVIGWYEDRSEDCLKRLDELGLVKEAVRQYQDEANYLYHEKSIIFTQDFVFTKAFYAVVPYADIVWCSVVEQSAGHGRTVYLRGSYLEFATLYSPPRELSNLTSMENVNKMVGIISSKNPDVMVGKTLENRVRYTALRENQG